MRTPGPLRTCLWTLLVVAVVRGGLAGAQEPDTPYHALYDELRGVAPDADHAASVSGLTLAYDAGTLNLESGELHLLQPVRGRPPGAVWVGEGRFTMEAPIPIEQARLERLHGSSRVDVPMRRAVLFFSDDVESILPGVAWEARPASGAARGEAADALDHLTDGDGWIQRDLALALLSGTPGFFQAHIDYRSAYPLVFQVTPFDAEEVSLSWRTGDAGAREILAQFHRLGDYETGRSMPQESLDLIRVARYDVAATIADNLDFAAVATLSVQRLRPEHDWVPFGLYPELDVDSVRWQGGSAAPFVRPDGSGELWVDVGSAPSDTSTLAFFYGGDLLDQTRNLWVEMKSTTGWLPVHEFGRPAIYRLTFRHPSRLRVAAVGSKVEEAGPDSDGMISATWQTPPLWQATFNVGRFVERDAGDSRFPDLKVHYDERSHQQVGRNIDDLNYLSGRACYANCRVMPRQQEDMGERVASDLRTSLAFFQDVFGATSVGGFTASEIPYGHGEAWGGLILLSWSTFGWTAEQGYDEMFRAHEVAHQWWGIGVRPATYRDRWLAEGFAEFSGLWYMARARGSLDLLTRRLREMREALLDRRDEAGPIWLGTRVGTQRNPEDYPLIVYQKGAWVLHMLRVLLTDQDTGSDARFEAMMKEFYSTYFGRLVSTQQFASIVEKHAAIPMGWFFDQWVYGTAIPRYTVSHAIDQVSGGQYRVRIRARQDRVPDTFQMVVPVYLDFGSDGYAYASVVVDGTERVTELPLLPAAPLEVVFNPFESVLAEVRTERWRD